MKKAVRYSFLILLIASCLIIVPVVLLRGSGGPGKKTDVPVLTTTTKPAPATTTTSVTTTATTVTTTTTVKIPAATTSGKLPSGEAKVSFPDTLFIGDSRSVGLSEYGKLADATFFCSVGMNAYKVGSEAVDVSGMGKITLKTLLQKKQFRQVYVMLGINELGYGLQNTVNKYQEIVTLVREQQPQAKVIIQSTLHVTKACNDDTSKSKAIFTNARINEFNSLIAALADQQTVYYLDINPAFDDANGCLNSNYAASDGIHIKAKYYLLWREYLDQHRIAG